MPSRLVLPGGGARIKALLLDQSVLAGCGNIYADESLFRAGIRPDAQLVSADRLKRLHAALREVLLESIDACGSSIRDYRTARGDAGAFQNAFRVYGRSGETCLECGTPLESCRIAGAGHRFLARTVSWPDIRSYNPFTRPQGLKNAEDDLPVAG